MAAAKENKQKPVVYSEDELGRKWDQCLTDTSIKIASGLGLGIVFSVLFLKRRSWPVVFGAGVGLGMGYGACDNSFQNRDFLRGKIRKVEAITEAPKST
jgi:inner membrane organizing system protein 1